MIVPPGMARMVRRRFRIDGHPADRIDRLARRGLGRGAVMIVSVRVWARWIRHFGTCDSRCACRSASSSNWKVKPISRRHAFLLLCADPYRPAHPLRRRSEGSRNVLRYSSSPSSVLLRKSGSGIYPLILSSGPAWPAPAKAGVEAGSEGVPKDALAYCPPPVGKPRLRRRASTSGSRPRNWR
jgi:hypothetical protein